uniref:NADH-ubiquinone oxidoreductase chain 5 n=1 Tax=Curculionidae sp. 2 AH-2016 TaxID=1903828 RepID=A0A343C2N7_9CUCU|nr:NADH dehydrogenase subunit 5 [Curculionidae sp. 2 AH-2016]
MNLIYNFYFKILLSVSLYMYMLSLFLMFVNKELIVEYNLISVNSVSFNMILYFDWNSILFVSFVLLISSMIIKYSISYMSGEKYWKRFLMLMLLFIVSMMMMILSPNLISILVGWDGLGLVSYLLVIYYQNMKSFNAGMLTALSNRLGDAALLVSIAWMMDLGSWSFLNLLDFMKESKSMMYVLLFIILAAITKSAQIPFSSWLPAAMAAPTPVSSLVHSSTLVTAGVYLLYRFSYLISNELFNILLYLSLLTMFMAGLCANFEYDLKKIIALSTLSQLGMMITIMCLGNEDLAFFHLLIHALFKALLFMCAGVIIHNLMNCQDIRYMGGLLFFMPITSVCLNISNMALCGLPFLSGFYSKDLIAEAMSMKFLGICIFMIFYFSIGLTVSYTIRLSNYLFYSDFNMLTLNMLSDNNNKIMLKSMVGLVILVIFKGSILMWLMFYTPYFIILPMFLKLLTLMMIFTGILVGYEVSNLKYNYSLKSLSYSKISSFLVSMWNLPILSTMGLNMNVLLMGKIYSKNFDSGWMEYYGSKNIFYCSKNLAKILQILSLNHLKVYLFLMFIFILILTIFL